VRTVVKGGLYADVGNGVVCLQVEGATLASEISERNAISTKLRKLE